MVGCGRGCHLPVQSAVAEYRESLVIQCVVHANATLSMQHEYKEASVPYLRRALCTSKQPRVITDDVILLLCTSLASSPYFSTCILLCNNRGWHARLPLYCVLIQLFGKVSLMQPLTDLQIQWTC